MRPVGVTLGADALRARLALLALVASSATGCELVVDLNLKDAAPEASVGACDGCMGAGEDAKHKPSAADGSKQPGQDAALEDASGDATRGS